MRRLLCVLGLALIPTYIKAQIGLPWPGPGAASSGGVAPTFVTDATNNTCGSVSTCPTTSFTPQTGDDLWVVVFFSNSSTTSTGVTDTCGTSGGASNSYTADATNTHAAMYHTIVGFGKACVATASYGGTVTGNELIYVQAIRGGNASTPMGANTIGLQNAPSTGTDTLTSNSTGGGLIASTETNDYVAGVTINCWGFVDTYSAGTGYTIGGINTVVGNCDIAGEHKVQAATSSSIAATFSLVSTAGGNNNQQTAAAVIKHP